MFQEMTKPEADGKEASGDNESSLHQLRYRGLTVDATVWLEESSRCHYLPEDEMIMLCDM